MPGLKIKEWNTADQPREKLIRYGAGHLTDAELLAILISSGRAGESALDIAKKIVSSQNYSTISTWHSADFKAYNGIGNARALTLLAAIEWSRRIHRNRVPKTQIKSSHDAYEVFRQVLSNPVQEEAWMLCLDRSNSIVAQRFISRGGVSATILDIRLICRFALETSASGVVIAHNHPSGQLKPSASDIQITQKITTALGYIDIKLLDHLILTEDKYLSFADKGLITF
jgi:DNA repair protein RadC